MRGRPARQSRFAFQGSGQAFFDSIASWVCALFPCFLAQASQYGGERTRTFQIYRVIFIYFMPVLEMKLWRKLTSQDG